MNSLQKKKITKLESQIEGYRCEAGCNNFCRQQSSKRTDDYDVANAAWEKYGAASDEILQLSREGKQQEASKLMTGEVYEEYKALLRN